MKWQDLTTLEIAKAAEELQVCVLPLGTLEPHGGHLPLGTDLILAEEFVSRAAQIEPVVEFPGQYLTMLPCIRHQPGAVITETRLIFEILDSICGEIARNGFRKILIVNCHGGNVFVRTFVVDRIHQRRDYVVYAYRDGIYPVEHEDLEAAGLADGTTGHGGADEVSILLYVRPELVKLDKMPTNARQGLRRHAHLQEKQVVTGFDWFAANPDHYMGDAAAGSREKGEVLVERVAQRLAAAFRVVKEDTTAPAVLGEFYEVSGL